MYVCYHVRRVSRDMSNGGHENFHAQVFVEKMRNFSGINVHKLTFDVVKESVNMFKWLGIEGKRINGKKTQIHRIFKTVSQNKREQQWT